MGPTREGQEIDAMRKKARLRGRKVVLHCTVLLPSRCSQTRLNVNRISVRYYATDWLTLQEEPAAGVHGPGEKDDLGGRDQHGHPAGEAVQPRGLQAHWCL